MSFLDPGFLWLLLLAPAFWFWPRRLRDPLHGILRVLVWTLLVLGLARPAAVSREEPAHRVLVLDRSPSLDAPALRSAAEALRGFLAAAEPEERLFLVDLAGPSAPPLDPADRARFEEIVELDAGRGTPWPEALAAAARLVPRGAPAAVVAVTDGLVADRSWGPALAALSLRDIPVHAALLPRIEDDVRPVALEPLGEAARGRTVRLLAEVVGGEAEVRLLLRSGERVVARSPRLRLEERLRHLLAFEPAEAGFLPLALEVEVLAGRDARRGNEILERTLPVQDPLRVLHLGHRTRGSERPFRDLVGAGFDVVSRDDLPSEGGPDLGDFDAVVLDDRPASTLPEPFQRRLVEAVENEGLGLLVAGGSGAFGPGGYHEQPIEEALPVELVQKEEKKDPSTALAVIIDTSGSMGGVRMVLAKEVARLAIRRLLPHDKVGIVEFYGTKHWAAPLQSAANAIDIQRALNRLDAGGGTVLYPAIEEAYYGLRNVQTRYKHVLVLTDAGVESGPYEALLRRMSRDGIAVSTVLVGPGRHSDFLVQLSDWGGGRFYNASDRFNLPEVMIKQPSTARLPAYRPGVVRLRTRGGRGWWGEVDREGVPDLAGYVETRTRPGAEVLVATERDDHPVLATWGWGLGRVTAMTTEPSGAGTEPWRDWPGYGPLLGRVLERTASADRRDFDFRIERRGAHCTLVAERRSRTEARPTARLLGAGETSRTLSFRRLAPALFEARFLADPELSLRLLAGVEGAGPPRRRLVAAPRRGPAAELQVDPDRGLDPELLARETGGRFLAPEALGEVELALGGGAAPAALRDLRPWAFLLALLAFLADLAWRRRPGRRIAE